VRLRSTRGQDEQEDEEIISEEGSRKITSTRSAMEEWCAKHDIGRFVGYNRKQKVNLGANSILYVRGIKRRIRGLFMSGKR